jgi:hypothetical protein
MTPQQLLGVGVRLFAVWLALTSVAYFTSIPTALNSTPGVSGAAVAYVIGGAYLFGALALWFFPMVVAHTVLPRTKFENRLSLNAHELARVGSSLIGLWLFAKALPSLVWFVLRSFLFMEAGSSFSSLSGEAKLDLAVAVFELVFAAFLIAKSGVFAAVAVPEAKSGGGAAGDP